MASEIREMRSDIIAELGKISGDLKMVAEKCDRLERT